MPVKSIATCRSFQNGPPCEKKPTIRSRVNGKSSDCLSRFRRSGPLRRRKKSFTTKSEASSRENSREKNLRRKKSDSCLMTSIIRGDQFPPPKKNPRTRSMKPPRRGYVAKIKVVLRTNLSPLPLSHLSESESLPRPSRQRSCRRQFFQSAQIQE